MGSYSVTFWWLTHFQDIALKPVRFLMIGGFLGAGKTTTIAKVARHYMNQGQKVGLVTNDQAYNLVDTNLLRSQGFDVGEVPGACFCCKFNDLVDAASQMGAENAPDIIIAEPVGSCTDLVATVIEPLRQLYGDRFEVGPLAVLLKPTHGKKILKSESNLGFSPKAAYIFLKQIEEAQIVAINKIDRLSESDQQELIELVGERFPNKKTILMSARTDVGVEDLVELMASETHEFGTPMEMDYDKYAEGEAELGWCNCEVEIRSLEDQRFELDKMIVSLTEEICAALKSSGLEPAHLKIMGQYGVDAAVANLVDSDTGVELSLASEIEAPSCEAIVNARVGSEPEKLKQIVEEACEKLAAKTQTTVLLSGMQSFSPGRPNPTHRMT